MPAVIAPSAPTEIVLAGRTCLLQRPRGARALYVLAHGAGAGMRHAFMADVAAALAAHQVATLRWEFPYMAAGKKRVDAPAVAEAAVRELWTAARARFGKALSMFAGGKSFGGRMTSRAHAAAPLPGLAGLAFLGFPLHPANRPGTARAEHLAATTGPLLFVQGTRDALAELGLVRPIVRALGPRASLHEVAAADHGFDVLVRSGRTPAAVMAEIAETVANWMDRVARRG